MKASERVTLVHRWAKALWQAEVAAGNCSTPEPLTAEMRFRFEKVAAAAVDAADRLSNECTT